MFSFFYDICQLARTKQENCFNFKLKAFWALLEGVGKSGVYFFS